MGQRLARWDKDGTKIGWVVQRLAGWDKDGNKDWLDGTKMVHS
jgi:hypothetical protein